jgi:hypothetical protein
VRFAHSASESYLRVLGTLWRFEVEQTFVMDQSNLGCAVACCLALVARPRHLSRSLDKSVLVLVAVRPADGACHIARRPA